MVSEVTSLALLSAYPAFGHGLREIRLECSHDEKANDPFADQPTLSYRLAVP